MLDCGKVAHEGRRVDCYMHGVCIISHSHSVLLFNQCVSDEEHRAGVLVV